MNRKNLIEHLSQRYSEHLYLGYYKSSIYHFFYGYKRILIEVIKSVVSLLNIFKKKNLISAIGIYSTNNQLKALTNSKEAGIHDANLINVNILSFKSALLRLLVWILKFFLYPLIFIFSKKKQGLYFFMMPYLMQLYCRQVVNKLVARNVDRVYLSNDHSGDIFIISILLRDIPSISVSYIQHGAVKKEFPINYFDEVYVYDRKYADIYKNLCKNKNVRIYINQAIEKGDSFEDLTNIDILICLSHQFPIFAIFKALRLLIANDISNMGIRFHPSDRLAKIKYQMLSLFFSELIYCDPKVSYINDFGRSAYILCASSSLLIDSYEKGFSEKLIWVKPFGLKWDYYNLEGKIITVDLVSKLMDHINFRRFLY